MKNSKQKHQTGNKCILYTVLAQLKYNVGTSNRTHVILHRHMHVTFVAY
jgi:hypothetical protein